MYSRTHTKKQMIAVVRNLVASTSRFGPREPTASFMSLRERARELSKVKLLESHWLNADRRERGESGR
jgi:hypothetical protein